MLSGAPTVWPAPHHSWPPEGAVSRQAVETSVSGRWAGTAVAANVPEQVWPLPMPVRGCVFHLFLSMCMCTWGVWT